MRRLDPDQEGTRHIFHLFFAQHADDVHYREKKIVTECDDKSSGSVGRWQERRRDDHAGKAESPSLLLPLSFPLLNSIAEEIALRVL
jgi:hypothetical protein